MAQKNTRIVVEDATRSKTLAEGNMDDSVVIHEGSYYFDENQVDMTNLNVTERTSGTRIEAHR